MKLAHIFSVPVEQLLPDVTEDSDTVRDLCQPSSMVRSLSKEERGLLTLYRSLTKEQKKTVMMKLTELVRKEKG